MPDGSYDIETTPATFDDAIDDRHIVGSVPMIIGGLEPVAKEQVQAQLIASGIYDFSGPLFDNSFLTVEMTSGVIEIGGQIDWEADYHSLNGLERFSIVLTGNVDLDLDAAVSVHAAGVYQLDRELFRLPPPFFLIGLVAGQVNVVFDAGVEVTASVAGEVTSGFDIIGNTEATGSWADGTWRTSVVPPAPGVQAHPLSWNLDGTVGARVFVRPKIEVLFYSIAGPTFDLEPYLNLDGAFSPCDYAWELSGGLSSHLGINLGALSSLVPELPRLELFDISTVIASDSDSTGLCGCGNGVCETPEDCVSCPSDCGPCQPPTGACCFTNGQCQDGQTESACANNGGILWLINQSCASNPCPPPPPTGACCFANGTCQPGQTENECVNNSGVTWFVNEDCSPNPCACDAGFCNLDGDPLNGCEFDLNSNPSCSSWGNLGSVSGDMISDPVGLSGIGEAWYRVQIREDSSSWPVYLSASIYLDSGPNSDYALCVYCGSCAGSLIGCSAAGTGGTGLVDVRWDDNLGQDDDGYVFIQIIWFDDGGGCDGYELEVIGFFNEVDVSNCDQ